LSIIDGKKAFDINGDRFRPGLSISNSEVGLSSLPIAAFVLRLICTNRLCVDLDYQGSTRRIEPYSLRRTKGENIILHAWNVDKNEHRSYRVDRIQGARATNQIFTPRYAIELTPSGPVSIPPVERRSSS